MKYKEEINELFETLYREEWMKVILIRLAYNILESDRNKEWMSI